MKWKVILYKKLARYYYLSFGYNKWLAQLRVKVAPYYAEDLPEARNGRKTVVFMADGKLVQGGLSDRLMGIMATYQLCKELGLEFRIFFNHPFPLSDYLVPNRVNWLIEEKELCYNSRNTLPVVMMSWGGKAEKKKQRKHLMQELQKDYKQIHVYTNAHFVLDKQYSELFHELFTFSDRLKDELDSHLQQLGNRYVSVSLRFLQLLGDFKDTDRPILSQEEATVLIEKCENQVLDIHKRHPGSKLFVASDSITFLNKIKDRDFVYTIPGTPVHIDYCEDASFDRHKKTFIDFFVIAHARKIYLLQTGQMYKSNYPFSASLVNNTPFERIKF